MGNMEGCLRAAGLAAAAEHKSGDMLAKREEADDGILERQAQACGRQMITQERLPQPMFIEEGPPELPQETLPEPPSDQGACSEDLASPAQIAEDPADGALPERLPLADVDTAEPAADVDTTEPAADVGTTEPAADGDTTEPAEDCSAAEATQLDPTKSVAEEFKQLDTNGDGVISKEEWLQSQAEPVECDEASQITEILDPEHTWTPKEQQAHQQRQLSRRFEKEASEALSRNQVPPEVSKFLAGENVPVSQNELEDMHAWFGESESEEEDPDTGMQRAQPLAQNSEQPASHHQSSAHKQGSAGLCKFLDSVKPGFGEQYTSCLCDGGFETGRALSLASATDLQECGVARGHALLIVDTIQKVAQYL